jgi:hypothetical protein
MNEGVVPGAPGIVDPRSPPEDGEFDMPDPHRRGIPQGAKIGDQTGLLGEFTPGALCERGIELERALAPPRIHVERDIFLTMLRYPGGMSDERYQRRGGDFENNVFHDLFLSLIDEMISGRGPAFMAAACASR